MSEETFNMRLYSLNQVNDVQPDALNSNFSTLENEFGQRGINPMWFGAVGDGIADDTGAIIAAINAVPEYGGVVIFPPGKYLITKLVSIYERKKITLKGLQGATLIVDNITFLRIFNSSNIKVEGFSIVDKSYTNEIYFKEIILDYNSLLTPNSNSNITVTPFSPEFTISKNESTKYQTYEYYSVFINLDQIKEHTIQTYDGIVRGENASNIKLRKYYNDTFYKEYNLDHQNQEPTSPGRYRWHSNYLESGIVKIELRFPYSYLYTSDNNPITYNLSKIRLFQGAKPLPGSNDDINISIQRSSSVTFKNNEFIGLQKQVFSTLYENTDINYINNYFNNCFINCIDIANVSRSIIEKNQFKINVRSDTGQDVMYTKSVCRAVRGTTASSDITIRDNYISGLYFGAEIWYCNNLLIEGLTAERIFWGLSICNNTTGTIRNGTFRMRDNWRIGIELSGNQNLQNNGVKVNVDHINFTGRSYGGVLFSLTTNTKGLIKISNVETDSCFIFTQFTHKDVYLENIEVKELLGIGILALQGGDYSTSKISLENVKLHYSTSLKINNPAYQSSFVKTNSSTIFIGRIYIRNCDFLGLPCNRTLDVRTNELIMDNVVFDSESNNLAKIRLKDLPNKLSIIYNCQLFSFDLSSAVYLTAGNSRLLLKYNKLSSSSIIPSHLSVLVEDNVYLN